MHQRVRRSPLRLGWLTVLLVVLATSTAAFDVRTLRQGGIGHTAVLSRPAASEVLAVGHGFSTPGVWTFDAGYARRFELKELDTYVLAAGVRWRWLSLSAGASQFGRSELYAEQILKGNVAAHWRGWSLGAGLSAMQIQTGGSYVDLRAATVSFALSYRHHAFVLAVNGDNLTRPELAAGSLHEEPTCSLFGEYKGPTAYSLMGSARWCRYQPPRFGLGQMIRLSDNGAFYWGVASGPLEFGGGIELFLPAKMVLSYMTTVHPVLGFTHTVSWSIGSATGWKVKGHSLD